MTDMYFNKLIFADLIIYIIPNMLLMYLIFGFIMLLGSWALDEIVPTLIAFNVSRNLTGVTS